MRSRTVQLSLFEVTWVIIAFLIVAIFFLLQQIRETPPYIVLSETEEDYRFDSGSFELSAGYREALAREVVPQIAAIARDYRCDVIQVIGHTDGVGMKQRGSNLDETVLGHLQARRRGPEPMPGSNIDLGMLRAIAVARFLREALGDESGVTHILPLSAGPMIDPDGSVRTNSSLRADRNARRVELRLTVTSEQR